MFKANVLSHKVVSKSLGKYLAWPSITSTPWGEIIIAFSGDRDAHVCPFGKTQIIRSLDGGATWSDVQTVNDTPLDDRDAGIICLADGTLLVSWFTHDYSQDTSLKARPPEVYARYKPVIDAVTPLDRQLWTSPGLVTDSRLEQYKMRGHFVRTSNDQGKTWGPAVRTTVSAPHGPNKLADGRLIYLGNNGIDRVHKTTSVLCNESTDNGQTWRVVGAIPMFTNQPGCEVTYLVECHVVQTDDGRLVGAFRHEAKNPQTDEILLKEGTLYFADSADNGRTWSKPERSEIFGKPPHLLKLKDGKLIVSYGYRIKPYGQRVCVSTDHGRTWPVENVLSLRDDAPNGDLGYPASIQLPDDSILSVYYQIDKTGEKTSIMTTHWRLEEA